jgi:hypothetical protein
MLEVQKYLRTKTLDDLTAELGIFVARHDSLPLVILNYDQIESFQWKTHPIVRECRALTLRSDNYNLVARSFSRFFNLGEVEGELESFDFSDFVVDSKEDGSLSVIYHFDSQWHANTRGSFGTQQLQSQDFTWRDAFVKAMGLRALSECGQHLNPEITYICEFCSPWNKVVRRYDLPVMFLLTAFRGSDEVSWEEADQLAAPLFRRPTRYEFHSVDEIRAFLESQAKEDPTFEGVVIRDRQNHRIKVKSASYFQLHALIDNGNILTSKRLLPFVLAGDEEVLLYVPEAKGLFYELKSKILEAYIQLVELWHEVHHIKSQKDFAFAIQGKTPFTKFLFDVRGLHGPNHTLAQLRTEWRTSEGSQRAITKWLTQ